MRLPPKKASEDEARWLVKKLCEELGLNFGAHLRTSLGLKVAAEAWRRGTLTYKLHSDQRSVLELLQAGDGQRFVLEIARRWGKTWLLAVLAVEACIRKPHTRVIYVAPTLSILREFILPTLEKVCADAPPELRGHYNSSRNHWEFPNDSFIHLAGCDDKRKADRGRGPAAHVAIVDEAGFIPILDYVLRSVLRPQLLTTGGRLLIASTPAEEPDHPFTARAERAEAEGYYARRTIHDNPRLTTEAKERFIADDARDYGCSPSEYQETDEFRREHLAQRVVDKLLVVVPEWEKVRTESFVALPRPEYFDGYTTLDFGGADPHAATLGYWDFERAALVITGEMLLRNGENTHELALKLKAKEKEQWGVDKYDGALRIGREDPRLSSEGLPDWLIAILEKEAPRQPYSRVCDNDLQLARDLYELHGMAFIPTRKDDLELQVNNLRVLVGARKLYVHPSCIHTDRHLRTTTWENHKRRGFSRKAGEHGDLVATLIYKARNIDRQRNPTPEHLRYKPPTLGAQARLEREKAAGVPDIFKQTALGRRLSGRR